MPGGFSQPGFLGPPGNAMAYPPQQQHQPHRYNNMPNEEGWQKDRQPQRGPGNMHQMQGQRMQPQQQQGWQEMQGWQGQLGPNLMPLTGPAPEPRAVPRGRDFPGAGYMQSHMAMQHQSGAMQHQNGNHEFSGAGIPTMGMGMQNMRREDASRVGPQVQQMQPVGNVQGPMVQVIALPAGTPPPEGAIPVGPASTTGMSEQPYTAEQAFWQPPPMQRAPVPQAPVAAPMIQMIAVPVGEGKKCVDQERREQGVECG